MTHQVQATLQHWAPRDKWFVLGKKATLMVTAAGIVDSGHGVTLTKTPIKFALPGGVFNHSSPCIRGK
jgi:hypothetical protein